MLRTIMRLSVMLILAGCSTAGVDTTGSARAPDQSGFKVLRFDRAMPQQLGRSMPLNVAFPRAYEMVILNPAARGVVWARRDDAARIRATGAAPSGSAFFFGRLTPNIGYDMSKGMFTCGAGCGEDGIVRQLTRVGARDVKTEKRTVNRIPLLFVEADTSAMKNSSAKRIYMVYIATLVDPNAMLISYRPDAVSVDQGRAVWRAFKDALLAQ